MPRDPNTGRYTNYHNEPIPVDDWGKPLDNQGQVLPTNEIGQYVHNQVVVLPTSSSGRPIVVVNPDGSPLSTSSSGIYVQGNICLKFINNLCMFCLADGSPGIIFTLISLFIKISRKLIML